jgi:two-component system, OmpR family, phosphate regulon sensor histidine kinase PhoR
MNRFFNSYKARITLAVAVGLLVYFLLYMMENVLQLESSLVSNHLVTSAAVGAVLFFIFEEVLVSFRARQVKILNMIVGALQRISAGDLSVQLPETGAVELRQVSKLTNQIVRNLKDDIAKLEKLERVRSEFLANVSHELRTPIFSIQGFIETLIDGAIDDTKVNRDFLQKAYEHSERLNILLNDLIEISRIESGEMRMSFRYFNVSEFLQSVTEEMKPKAGKKSLQLGTNFSPGEILVLGDRERLRQVLSNLIDNAIKYTDEGGRIEVGFSELQDSVRVYVADNGSGIGEEHLERVFERFYRVDKNRSRSVGGTGLGLAIVKHIIEAHNSKIEVKSELGKGSEFSFRLKK